MARRQSGYLKRLGQAQKIRESYVIKFAIQRIVDCAVVTLHQEFGFGAERNKRFVLALNDILDEMADIVLEDDKHDRELVYSQTKLDNAVKAALGEHFVSWEERYP